MEALWTTYNALAFLSFSSIVTIIAFKLAKIFYVYYFAKRFLPKVDFRKRFGDWAVVTGGSDGIGKNYARELARRKVNLVLISNVREDLIAVSKEIENTFGVETRIVEADFSLGEEEYQRIFAQIEDLHISILVNNVGIAVGLPCRLDKLSRQNMWDLLMVNNCAAVAMANHFLPKMRRQKKGLIVNVSSASALLPTPFANLYGSCKIFIRRFSEALRLECQGTGVEIQTLCPCFVNTKICLDSNAGRQVGFMFPDPDVFAASAIDTVGITSLATGYWPHEFQYLGLELAPEWLTVKITIFLMSYKK